MLLRGRSGPRPMLLATIAIVYAAVIAVAGDVLVQGRYGWYRIVLYPLIYLAAGYLAPAIDQTPVAAGNADRASPRGATAVVMITGAALDPNPSSWPR